MIAIYLHKVEKEGNIPSFFAFSELLSSFLQFLLPVFPQQNIVNEITLWDNLGEWREKHVIYMV